MASADKFISPGNCHFADCEVTLVLDDESQLYACKHALVNQCQFFKGKFSGNFNEKGSNEVKKIRDISRSDMLLFLECEFGHKALPLDSESLCTLISLADFFICPSLQEHLNNHLGTESMFLNLSPDAKLALLCEVDKRKGGCPDLLETCIRLCANFSFMEVAPLLNAQISNGAMVAVYSMVTQAMKQTENASTHECPRRRDGEATYYDSNSTTRVFKEVDAIKCMHCGGTKIKETLTYEKVKQFEIDQKSMLKE